MEGSANIELDNLLDELCALEDQLNSSSSNCNLINSFSVNKTATVSDQKSKNDDQKLIAHFCNDDLDTSGFSANNVPMTPKGNKKVSFDDGVLILAPAGKNATEMAETDHLITPTDERHFRTPPQITCQFSVNQQQQQRRYQSQQNGLIHKNNSGPRTYSPDNDSAFCDSGSLTSGESLTPTIRMQQQNGQHNPSPEKLGAIASNQVDSINKSRTDAQSLESISSVDGLMSEEEKKAQIKAEKIKVALEKMREANIRRIDVKIFHNSLHSVISVDERWTVAHVVARLIKVFNISFSMNHCLIEICPDLHMERIYEDHEYLVENMFMWTSNSKNEIHLVDKTMKWDLFYNPQLYLLNDYTSKPIHDTATKQHLITDFFTSVPIRTPETAGILYLKSDGKKCWKKFYFTLRLTALYVCTKGNKSKSSKDLVCLSQLDGVQIHHGIGWRKKYKAPTDFGFAIKHPKIQTKSSKYVKYFCAESQLVLNTWITALRLAKHGKQLYDNFIEHCELVTENEERILLEEPRSLEKSKSSQQKFENSSLVSSTRTLQFDGLSMDSYDPSRLHFLALHG